MEPKKLAWQEQLLHLRRKAVSGYAFGIGVFIFVLAVILLNYSIKSPLVEPMWQTVKSFRVNSSVVSWPFSSSKAASNASSGMHKSVANVEKISESEKNLKENGHANYSSVNEKVENVSIPVVGKSLEASGSDALKKETKATNGNTGNFSLSDKKNKQETVERHKSDNVVIKGESVAPSGGYLPGRNNTMPASRNASLKDCDIFDGKWVRDDSKPYYPAGSCPYVDRDFDCHLNGRPDDGYVKWKWQPNSCNIPSLNATDFLERLRGNRLVFVGDSLNRNMWESLVCILHHSVGNKSKVFEISGRREFKKKGFYAFRFEDYDCSVDFVSSPFLVRESSFQVVNGSFETLRLDLIDRTTYMYRDADIIIFNTGHWWTHEKTSRGEDYYQEGNYVHPRLKVLEAYKRALRTWANWIDKNINREKSQVLFRGYSVTHFSGGQWNSGGQCHKETLPIFNETHLSKYPSKMRVLEYVLQEMKTPVIYLNISRITDYRKDAHPSIYRTTYKSLEEQNAAEQTQDCSHWCLPGVPDTWNELLYASLLKTGRGSWKNR